MDATKGKICHDARIEIENFIHNISIDKLNELYEIYAEMGLGRNIIAYFTKDSIEG